MGKTKRYFLTGLKLALILMLGGLIMLIPSVINMVLALTGHYIILSILWIVFILIGFIVNGWLIIKFRKWIFKGVK